jgi:hypothetical protein
MDAPLVSRPRGRRSKQHMGREYLPLRSEADFEEWRHQEAWTAEKYRRFDRGERMPPDWKPPQHVASG